MRGLPKAGGKPREVAEAVNQLMLGRSNAIGTLTLDANQASTTLSKNFIAINSVLLLTPQTANAAAEISNGTLYVAANTATGSFTITHANNAQTDRTFGYLIVGGIDPRT